MKSEMKVVEIGEPGPPDVLRIGTREIPKPRDNEILIKLSAAGVNRPDVIQRSGRYDPPPGASDLPGLEAAGKIVSVGSGVRRWRVDDDVTALLPGGGYAEYAVTPAEQALPILAGLDMVQAARRTVDTACDLPQCSHRRRP